MSVGDELSNFHLSYKSLFCLHFRRVFLLGIEFQVGGYLFFSILQMPVNGIFCLPFSWKVSSQCCCAIKSHTFFPLRAWTFSSCLRHLQSCWNQCVVFIFESMVWFLNQLLPLSLSVSSVAQCLTPCDPMDCSMPGFPVHHQLPELPQAHVHRVGDAIQPAHPLSSPSPPAFNLSQSWLFTSGSQSTDISVTAWVLPINIQDGFPLGLTDESPWSPRDSQESSAPQFKSINSSTFSLLYGPTLTFVHDYWKKSKLWVYVPLSAKCCLCFLILCLGLS